MIDLNVITLSPLSTTSADRCATEAAAGSCWSARRLSYVGWVRHTVYGGAKAFGRIFAEGLWAGAA